MTDGRTHFYGDDCVPAHADPGAYRPAVGDVVAVRAVVRGADDEAYAETHRWRALRWRLDDPPGTIAPWRSAAEIDALDRLVEACEPLQRFDAIRGGGAVEFEALRQALRAVEEARREQ